MILSALSAKAWQAVAVGLLVMLLIASAWLGWSRLVTIPRLESKAETATKQRDAWKDAAAGFEQANGKWAGLAEHRKAEIEADQSAQRKAAEVAAGEVARAKAAQKAADARLNAYQQRPRSQSCAALLTQLDTTCPELKGY